MVFTALLGNGFQWHSVLDFHVQWHLLLLDGTFQLLLLNESLQNHSPAMAVSVGLTYLALIKLVQHIVACRSIPD
jgi:hypothetical protein